MRQRDGEFSGKSRSVDGSQLGVPMLKLEFVRFSCQSGLMRTAYILGGRFNTSRRCVPCGHNSRDSSIDHYSTETQLMKWAWRTGVGLGVTILACAAGCSGDGDFFPGMLNHNEGAVDYRVAPIAVRDESSNKSHSRLDLDDNMPYIQLGTADNIGAFSRTKTPAPLLRAEDEVNRKQRAYADSDAVFRIEENTLRNLEGLLARV